MNLNISTPKKLYSVNIDFDEAKMDWRENKKYIGNGVFKYTCKGVTNRHNRCKNTPTNSEFCHLHLNQK